jgi:mersacidin/lichenicidin family type 2 lantibiotic
MSNEAMIRAWKDTEYRESLSQEQRSQLSANPAGLIELSDAELSDASGGIPWTIIVISALACTFQSDCRH